MNKNMTFFQQEKKRQKQIICQKLKTAASTEVSFYKLT